MFVTIKELLEPLYHGTCADFTDIDLDRSTPKKDFGRGFAHYTKPETSSTFDIVIGPVANDAVGVVLNNFIDGVYGEQTAPEAKETAIRLLLTQKLHNQVFFGTQQVVDRLTVVEKTDVYFD
jgi:hypothetical protein